MQSQAQGRARGFAPGKILLQGASPEAPGAQAPAADTATEKGQQKGLVRAREGSEQGTRSGSKR